MIILFDLDRNSLRPAERVQAQKAKENCLPKVTQQDRIKGGKSQHSPSKGQQMEESYRKINFLLIQRENSNRQGCALKARGSCLQGAQVLVGWQPGKLWRDRGQEWRILLYDNP